MKNENEKIGILHIIDKYGHGGVERIIYNLIDNYKSEKYILSYIFLRNLNNKDLIYTQNISIKDYNKYDLISPIKDIVNYIKENNIKVIHTHHRKGFYLAYILSFKYKDITFIHHEHSDIVPRNYIYTTIINRSIKKNFNYITVSNFLKNMLIEKTKLDSKNIHLLFNFVDLNKFTKITDNEKKSQRIKNNISDETFVFGFGGRIVERKGWKEFIRACRMLSDDGINYIAYIVGFGEEEVLLKNEIKKNNLKENVLFLGHCNDMKDFYSKLDCFVIPSHWEGMPMTQLEVMSSNIPMISSDGPGLNEICENMKECIYFKNKDIKDLYDKMKFAIHNKNIMNKIKDNSLKKINNFSLQTYIENLNNIYNKIIK